MSRRIVDGWKSIVFEYTPWGYPPPPVQCDRDPVRDILDTASQIKSNAVVTWVPGDSPKLDSPADGISFENYRYRVKGGIVRGGATETTPLVHEIKQGLLRRMFAKIVGR